MAHLLVVDDDDDVLSLLESDLSEEHKVTAINNGPDALSLFQSQEKKDPIDLLVTDLVMPRMSGSILAVKILEIRKIPVIVLSGADPDALSYSRELVDKGVFKEVMLKPAETIDILNRISFHLG